MRKAAEERDHRRMPPGPDERLFQAGFIAQTSEELHRTLLQGGRFGVRKWQVDEIALDGDQVGVEMEVDRIAGDLEGEGVSGEGAWQVAKGVTGELIEQ